MFNALLCFFIPLFAGFAYGQVKPRPPPNISTEDSVHESEIVFSVLYSLSLVASVVVFYFERKLIKPVILAHAARENNSDYSAVQTFAGKFNINERLQLSLPPKEKIIWGDVSLIISPVSHLILVIVNFAFGYILVITTHASETQLHLMFLLLIVLFLGFVYIGKGLRQVVGRRHFKDIYAFTENRLVIINFSHLDCRKPDVEYIAYQDISDVQLFIGSGDEIGSITFRKKTAQQGSIFGKGQYNSFVRFMDPSYREFLNIVNPREIEKLLLRNISAGDSMRSSEISYQEL
jgi:hypothetical protein